MVVHGLTRITMTTPEGEEWEFSAPGKVTIRALASEASGEGVEGEPEATLGGEEGSPRTGLWCITCGRPAWDQMICTSCWRSELEVSMVITSEQFASVAKAAGISAQQFNQKMEQVAKSLSQSLGPLFEEALDSQQSLDQATRPEELTLEEVESALERLLDSTSDTDPLGPGSTRHG